MAYRRGVTALQVRDYHVKVVHLNEHLAARGGIETYLLGLIPRLEAMGHEQAVCFASGDANLVRRAHHLPCLAQSTLRAGGVAYRQTRDVLDAERPDVIHVHNVYNIAAIRACLDVAPTVVTAHDYRYVCPASSYFYRTSRTICPHRAGAVCFCKAATQRCLTMRPTTAVRYVRRVQWMTSHAHQFARIIAPSGYCRDRVIAAGFDAQQVETIPYFCPIEPLPEPRRMPHQPLILFVGRASANKGYDVFIRALGKLPGNVRGRMVGSFSGGRADEVRRLAAEAGCADRLELGGWIGRDEVAATMTSASVFVFPSLWGETLGIVGLEAMACGVPVVASDVGGVRQWLEPDRNGVLVPPGNADALARAIAGILEDPARAHAMGEAGIHTIRDGFSPQGHVAGLLGCYHAALSRRAVPLPVVSPATAGAA